MAGTLLPRIRPLALISPDSAGALVDRYTDDAAPQGAHLSALPSIFPLIAQLGHAGPAFAPFRHNLDDHIPGSALGPCPGLLCQRLPPLLGGALPSWCGAPRQAWLKPVTHAFSSGTLSPWRFVCSHTVKTPRYLTGLALTVADTPALSVNVSA